MIGLHPEDFSQALILLEEGHLRVLKGESLLEPLQYQLTQFLHQGEDLLCETEKEARSFKDKAILIHPQELTQISLDDLFSQIDQQKNQLLNFQKKVRFALAIAWHTDRIDLIEKLSSLHEALQHQLTGLIGSQISELQPATGLYAFIEEIFSKIYQPTLKDEDLGIEGLVRLSIWRPQDYFEVGLLPKAPPFENAEESHFSIIQQQLEKLGISNVAGLKKHHIFSKHLLKDYIEKNQHLLAM